MVNNGVKDYSFTSFILRRYMKINKTKISIIIILFISILLMQFGIHFKVKIVHQNIIGNNYYSENKIKLNNNNNLLDELKIIQNKYSDYLIRYDLGNISYIQVFGKIEPLQLKEGRFIKENDQNVSVIGYNLYSKFQDTYIHEKKSYKIIGIISEEEAKLKNTVFLSSTLEEMIQNEIIIIDTYNDNLYEYLIENNRFDYLKDETIIFSNDEILEIILRIIYLVFVFATMITFSYYIEYKKDEIKLKILFGYTKMKLFLDIFVEFLVPYIVILTISSLIYSQFLSLKYIIILFLIFVITIYIPIHQLYISIRRNIHEQIE